MRLSQILSPLLAVALLLGVTLLHAEEKTPRTAKAGPAVTTKWLDAMQWRSIGPANMGGRITSLAVNPNDTTNWWAASASGGLLKTVDNGITFEHQFDHESVVSIGDVAVSASDPKVLWVGTGESNPRNSVSWGNGAYKSVDAGKTWKHMGLDGTFQISSVRIHPENPDIVYVGAMGRCWGTNKERGLFKTADGGKTWKKILYVDEKTGVIDVQMNPRDPDTLLVATWERQRDGFDTNDPAKKWGRGGGLWKTTDGGKTFRRIEAGLPTGKLGRIGIDYYAKDPDVAFVVLESERIGMEPKDAPYMGLTGKNAEVGARLTKVIKGTAAAKAGLKKDDIIIRVGADTVHSYNDLLRLVRQHSAGDKLEIEVSRTRKRVVLEIELGHRPPPKASKGPKGAKAPKTIKGKPPKPARPFGVFLGGQRENRQDQQGAAGHEYGGIYKTTDGGETWVRINSLNPRPMYFSEIRVDPSDEQRIWVLGIRLWRSKDGGKTFTPDGHPRSVHVDHHAFWIDPANGKHLILGNDGGIYVSYDRGTHYDHLNHVAIGQFYDVGVGPRRDYQVCGGLQDNGSWSGPSRVSDGPGPTNNDWIRIGGGDGFRVRVDPNDPELIYSQSQNGAVGRRHLGTGERCGFRPRPARGSKEKYRFNWYTPFVLSHHNSRIYYVAGNRVFGSLDRGNKLRTISPDITHTDRGSATALAESPLDARVLYVGTDDGAFWMTRDGGHLWSDLYAAAGVPKPEPTGAKPAGGAIASGSAAPEGGSDGDGSADAEEAPDDKSPRVPAEKTPKTAPEQAHEEAHEEAPPLSEVQPDRRWVNWIEPSRYEAGRVYAVFDGHRSDDDRPHLYVSEDFGAGWRSLTQDLPPSAGTTRVLREDIVNPNVLYLGTEFGAWVSIDRGESWANLGTNLPTVAVHQFAQHKDSGELVAGTHGRSLWVLDVTTLRQLDKDAMTKPVALYKPNVAVQWRPQPSRGAGRTFRGTNPPSGAQILYSFGKKTAGAKLEILSREGNLLQSLKVEDGAGLHRATWNLRGASKPGPNGRRRRAPRMGPGTYRVRLTVGGDVQTHDVVVKMDPTNSDPAWMAHEDAAEEAEAERLLRKRKNRQPDDTGRDE